MADEKTARESLDDLLAGIAKKHLHIKTLETRKSDSLDFHDCPVWAIKEALEEAFKAGVDLGASMATNKPLAEGGTPNRTKEGISNGGNHD